MPPMPPLVHFTHMRAKGKNCDPGCSDCYIEKKRFLTWALTYWIEG